MIDLLQFRRPQRYIGNEWNVVKKAHAGRIPICISYPDLYEIGMSNLGLRIIYGQLNQYPDIVCERVFRPGPDLAAYLKEKKQKLFSLETKTSLDEFQVLAFNFNYELNFTNFLEMLALSGIPLEAAKRKDLIVLGGGLANPEPLAEFVDVFFLGEFEEAIPAFIEVLRNYPDKPSRLNQLIQIPGFYCPSFYAVTRQDNKYIFEKKIDQAPLPLKRVTVKNLDNSYYPLNWLTPYTEIIHDRLSLEIARGCPNRCTFCQGRAIFCPYRERRVSTITNMLTKGYENCGYENFSLLAFSASDYSRIEALIDEAFDFCKTRRIGLSLPSLRADDIVGRLYQRLTRLKKSSLTVAIEAAQEPLRQKLNKKVDIKMLSEAAQVIRSLNIRHIKLYFMFGFPQEEAEDLEAIGDLLSKLNRQSRLKLNVSINIFIPKPFSLWEGVAMADEETLAKKRAMILQAIPRRSSLKVSLSHTKKSILEALLSRADRGFSKVIYRAFLKGAAPSENLSWDIWQEAMEESSIDYRRYLAEQCENFPWSHIEGGN